MSKRASSRANAVVLSLATLALLGGCGGEPAPPPHPPEATDTAAPKVPPPPAPSASAEVEAPPPPSATPSGSASAKAPPKPTSSGGGTPAVIKEGDTEITDTFGSKPAKLVLSGGSYLKLPEGALSGATNVTFKLDAKGKANGAPLGKIYRVTTVIPPSPTPSEVSSAGPPFEIALPAGNKKDANLAIGKVETDDKGREKIKWTVVAPKRIDDATGMAYYELNDLGDIFVHVTTKAPTEAKK